MTENAQLLAIRALARQHIAANTTTPEAALAALVRMGIYTAAGQLTPEYAQPRPVTTPRP